MISQLAACTYVRRKTVGHVNVCSGVAWDHTESLYQAASSALEDTQSKKIEVDLSQVDRLGTRGLQVVLALHRDGSQAGKTIVFSGAGYAVQEELRLGGLA